MCTLCADPSYNLQGRPILDFKGWYNTPDPREKQHRWKQSNFFRNFYYILFTILYYYYYFSTLSVIRVDKLTVGGSPPIGNYQSQILFTVKHPIDTS